MSITRRVFLKNGAIAIVGTSIVPSFLTRAVYAAETAAPGKKRLVVLFQRGAADGLNIVVPHGEQALLRHASQHRHSASANRGGKRH